VTWQLGEALTELPGDRPLDNPVPIRHLRMMESPFAFFRGTAVIQAADRVQSPASGIQVQACGDCHLMTFGGFATPEAGPGVRYRRLRRDPSRAHSGMFGGAGLPTLRRVRRREIASWWLGGGVRSPGGAVVWSATGWVSLRSTHPTHHPLS
jgi:hypothetical protein